jgi:hypothetical protein
MSDECQCPSPKAGEVFGHSRSWAVAPDWMTWTCHACGKEVPESHAAILDAEMFPIQVTHVLKEKSREQ